MAQFAIRAPSVADLFDPFSTEPLEDRPLREEVRERILRVWIDTREERPEYLTVELPEGERRDELARWSRRPSATISAPPTRRAASS